MFEDSLTPCSSDTSPFRGTKGREARETLTRDEEKKSTKSCSRRDAESVEKLKTKTMGREGKGRERKGREAGFVVVPVHVVFLVSQAAGTKEELGEKRRSKIKRRSMRRLFFCDGTAATTSI